MAKATFEFVIYIKDGCHLCDALLEELAQFKSEQAHLDLKFNVVDILDNELDFKRYHELIPIVFYQQQELCRYFFDPQAVLRVINTSTQSTE